MKKKLIYAFLFVIIGVFFYSVWRNSKIDSSYIIQQGEWVGEKYGVVRLDNNSDVLKNDTIFMAGKPVYKVIKLNKYFNEMKIMNIEDGSTDIFTSTEEFVK